MDEQNMMKTTAVTNYMIPEFELQEYNKEHLLDGVFETSEDKTQ
jgi:hypothetical protein